MFRVIIEFLFLPVQYLVPSLEYPGRQAVHLGHCPNCGNDELGEDDEVEV